MEDGILKYYGHRVKMNTLPWTCIAMKKIPIWPLSLADTMKNYEVCGKYWQVDELGSHLEMHAMFTNTQGWDFTKGIHLKP